MRNSSRTVQTGPVDELGKPGASQVDMEGSLGDGRKPNQLHHQSHLRCSSHARERKPVVWRVVFVLELTVPWEASVGEAYELKRLKCAEIAAEAEQRGWRTQVLPIEVGCRGFAAASTTKLLKAMGARGQAFRRAVKSGTPGTPDVAVEPSGGVVGLSTKHQ